MTRVWNMDGFIPPVAPGHDGTSVERSPYRMTCTQLVDTFGFSPERIAILNGLLNFRREMYAAGITNGFQWLNGSFMEDVEAHQGRSPNDIDVVSYIQLPDGDDQQSLLTKASHLFDNEEVRNTFKVDSYFEFLGEPIAERHIQKATYWYSMWSHNRNGNWKGFVRITLDSADDEQALQVLRTKGGSNAT